MDKKNIVILGGGFGGLRAAMHLSRKLKRARLTDRYQVILIDRHEYHTYTPLLPTYAVPPAHPSEAPSVDMAKRRFKNLLKGRKVAFLHGEVTTLDLARGDIHLAQGEEIPCHFLLLAPGSETNYFDIPGLEENSLSLKTFDDVLKIQTALSELFVRNPEGHVVVGGGGPTGIELASEIKSQYPKAKVIIVEAAPTLLPGFDPRLLRTTEKRLRRMGIQVLAGDAIASVAPGQATTKNGAPVPFDLFVWSGGVKAPAFLAALPLKTEPRGRVEVSPNMLCLPQSPDLEIAPMVYALGDCVCVYDPQTGKPMPGVAPTAMRQGEIAAQNIFADILKAEGMAKNPKRRIYEPMHFPYVLSVGRRWAVAKIGPIVFTGYLAWLFKEFIEYDYWWSVRP